MKVERGGRREREGIGIIRRDDNLLRSAHSKCLNISGLFV